MSTTGAEMPDWIKGLEAEALLKQEKPWAELFVSPDRVLLMIAMFAAERSRAERAEREARYFDELQAKYSLQAAQETASRLQWSARAEQAERERDEALARAEGAERHQPGTANLYVTRAAYDRRVNERDEAVLRAEEAEKALGNLRGTLTWVLRDLREWCEAVSYDSTWDSWDSHYKAFAYGGLDKAEAELHDLPPTPAEPKGSEQ